MEVEVLAEAIAQTHNRDWDALPEHSFPLCGPGGCKDEWRNLARDVLRNAKQIGERNAS